MNMNYGKKIFIFYENSEISKNLFNYNLIYLLLGKQAMTFLKLQTANYENVCLDLTTLDKY